MKQNLPMSAVPASTGWWGALGAAAAFGMMVWLDLPATQGLLCLLLASAIPMWWVELRRLRGREVETCKIFTPVMRLRGAMAVAGFYVVSTALHLQLGGVKTAALFGLVLPLGCIGVAALGLLCWIGRGKCDGLHELGLAISAVFSRASREDWMVTLIGGWLIKAFFLPLMLTWAYVWCAQLEMLQFASLSPVALFTVAMAALYAVDTAFGSVGYVSASKRIGAQIRSVDRTWLGCLSALACYPPLNNLVFSQLLAYEDGQKWQDWLVGVPWLSVVWGGAILGLTFIYVWATIAFGPRFSNLTHRGIITTGPYRWSKHPAYISKNLSWWLISMPFLNGAGFEAALLCSLCLLGVNAIYWLRAYTEERHLNHDPVYREYARWVQENGLLAHWKKYWHR